MHIVIPMSGIGKRFIDGGYKDPKPLIVIDGKPIIEHVVNLFPGETKFTFICNSDHLKTTKMKAILESIAPGCNIVEIAPHKKGPVYAVSQIADLIDDDEEVIVNYCDFGTYWDYQDFLKHTRDRDADGAIPSYKGFHPHMLGSTNYAFMRDEKQWMLEIKEKEPFTDNRMQEYASNGTYYFKKGAYVKKYFNLLMEKDINLKGEFYVSLIYNLLVEDGLKVSIYNIQHMLQWGIPEDVEEYNRWSNYFKHIVQEKPTQEVHRGSINLIPLAGKGSRFVKEGYSDPKPLIDVSGKPMIIQAVDYLPKAEKNIFVCLNEHLEKYPLESEITKVYPEAKILSIDGVTEGQACTCEIGLENEDLNSPLLIAACDNGMLYNHKKYQSFIEDENIDAIVFSFRNHPSSKSNPQMYGWIKTQNDDVTGVSVKVPISEDPFNDHAIVGAFYFKKGQYFIDSLNTMYKNNTRVNNEFYVDSCINELIDMGLKVKVLEVDDYICWGTPNDYRTFTYWQSYFHKDSNHPYTLETDITVKKDATERLNSEYRSFSQEYR